MDAASGWQGKCGERARRGVQKFLGIGVVVGAVVAVLAPAVPAAWGQGPPSPPPSSPPPASPPGMPLSLDDALKIASGESDAVAIAQGGAEQAEGNFRVARSGLFPQLSGSLVYSRTVLSQFGDLQIPAGTGPTGEIFTSLPFFQRNQYTAGLSLSQLLFDGGATTAQARAAQARKRSADLDVTAAQAQVLLDVVQTYFDAQLADQLVTIALGTLQENEQTLSLTQVARRVGDKSEYELLRSRVARDNQIPVVIQRKTERDEAYLRLKQLLNLALDTRLQLTTGVENLPARFAAISDLSPDGRAAVRQALLGLNAGEAQLAASRAQRWPTISFVTDYDPVAYPASGLPGISDFRNNLTIGVDITVPILTGGRIRGNELASRGVRDQAKARLSQTRKAAAYDARTAQLDLAQTQAALAATNATADEANQAYTIAQVRFRAGLSTQIELTDARLQQEQALSNRAQSLRNVQVARARLALWKDLPLAMSAGVSMPTMQTQPVTVPVPTPMVTNPLLGVSATLPQAGAIPTGGPP